MTRISDRALLWGTLAAAALFAYATFDAGAQAGPTCAPFEAVSKELERHKEVQIAGGIVGKDETAAIIVFGTPDGATWTLVSVDISTNSGMACIIASGEGWFQSNLLSGQPV